MIGMRETTLEREIPGFPGYFATVEGEIVSRRRRSPTTLRPRAHHRTGHLRVRLYGESADLRETGGTNRNGGRKRARFTDVYVHVLVCVAWHGPKPTDGHIVLHRDDDPNHNHPKNLRWGTAVENAADRDMDSDAQLEAAKAAWSEFSTRDEDGFDWATGELS